MSKEDYRHRDHDHLVEPLFGGLGVEVEAAQEEIVVVDGGEERRGLFVVVLSWIRVRLSARPPRDR